MYDKIAKSTGFIELCMNDNIYTLHIVSTIKYQFLVIYSEDSMTIEIFHSSDNEEESSKHTVLTFENITIETFYDEILDFIINMYEDRNWMSERAEIPTRLYKRDDDFILVKEESPVWKLFTRSATYKRLKEEGIL